MRRAGLLTIVAALVVVAATVAWNGLRQDREFRRLIARGEVALTAGQTFLAVEAFSGALALRPESMLAHLKRGDAYRRGEEFTAALRDLHGAVALDPSATKPRELLGDVSVAMSQDGRAIEHYEAYLALDERSPRVLYKLGLAQFRSRGCPSAVPLLRAALALDESLAEAHYTLALCLQPTSPANAVLELSRAIELQPSSLGAREELARVYMRLGRTREALDQFEALSRLEPANPARSVAVGLAEARLGRLDAAVSTLGKAVERHPRDPTVYAALGRVWLDRATNESDETALAKALEALQLAAASPTVTGESLGLYGRVLLLSGDLQGAERILEQARSRLPIDPARLLDLASVSEALGHLAAARSALMDYAALAPAGRASPSMLKVARLSLALDDGPTAVTWARRAVSESSATADALGLLAEALWHTGHGDEALDILGQALERDPDNEALADLGRRFSARRRGATHRLSDPRSAIARASDGTAFEAKTDEQLQQALPR